MFRSSWTTFIVFLMPGSADYLFCCSHSLSSDVPIKIRADLNGRVPQVFILVSNLSADRLNGEFTRCLAMLSSAWRCFKAKSRARYVSSLGC